MTLARAPEATDLYVYSVDLALRQHVQLSRDRTVESYLVSAAQALEKRTAELRRENADLKARLEALERPLKSVPALAGFGD